MRVTEGNFSATFMQNVNRNRERVSELQGQIASGKKVMKVSDDPQAANIIMRLNNLTATNEKYIETIVHAQSLVEITNQSLTEFSDMLTRVKEVTTRAISGGQVDAMRAAGEEIDQLLEEAVNLGNTKFDEKYIFGGTNSTEKPFVLSASKDSVTKNLNGIDGTISLPINDGVKQTVNVNGEEAFHGTAIFDLLISMRDKLKSGIAPDITQLNSLDGYISDILNSVSKTGIMLQNLTNNEEYLEQQKTQLMSMLSIQQDTDVAEKVTELKHSELMLEAALSFGAKILPKSLLDFLR